MSTHTEALAPAVTVTRSGDDQRWIVNIDATEAAEAAVADLGDQGDWPTGEQVEAIIGAVRGG